MIAQLHNIMSLLSKKKPKEDESKKRDDLRQTKWITVPDFSS